jgi:hypothetical protein
MARPRPLRLAGAACAIGFRALSSNGRGGFPCASQRRFSHVRSRNVPTSPTVRPAVQVSEVTERACYALVALAADDMHRKRKLAVRPAGWYHKERPTFSDAIAAVGRQLRRLCRRRRPMPRARKSRASASTAWPTSPVIPQEGAKNRVVTLIAAAFRTQRRPGSFQRTSEIRHEKSTNSASKRPNAT